MAATAAAARGEITAQTYDAIMAMRAKRPDAKLTELFAEHGTETGRGAAAVATAYYRHARSAADSPVKHRTHRTRRVPAQRASARRQERRPASADKRMVEAADRLDKIAEDLQGVAKLLREQSEVVSFASAVRQVIGA